MKGSVRDKERHRERGREEGLSLKCDSGGREMKNCIQEKRKSQEKKSVKRELFYTVCNFSTINIFQFATENNKNTNI